MDISLTAINHKIATALRRYHLVFYVVIVTAGLGLAVLSLNAIVSSSSESGDYVSASGNAQFDTSTVERINKLRISDQNRSPLELPAGRTNPFVE